MVNTQDISASLIQTALSTVDLISIAKEFHNNSQQVKLIQWFQSSTGAEKQSQFGLLWRDGQEKGRLDFVQVFKFYQGIPHQNAALRWLQQNSQSKTLDGLFRMWQSIPVPANQLVRLRVPYYEQTDNVYEPMRTCNTSSSAMCGKYLGAKIQGDDQYYKIMRKYGDTTDHNAQTKALAELGIKSTWHTDLGFNDLNKSLEAGLPIIVGILHRGTIQAPTGGHMIVVIGRTSSRDYICHDPFGSLIDSGGGYTGSVKNGNGVVYSRYLLNHRWLPEGDKSGWGRLFYGNKLSGVENS